jgi:hypothetical protein
MVNLWIQCLVRNTLKSTLHSFGYEKSAFVHLSLRYTLIAHGICSVNHLRDRRYQLDCTVGRFAIVSRALSVWGGVRPLLTRSAARFQLSVLLLPPILPTRGSSNPAETQPVASGLSFKQGLKLSPCLSSTKVDLMPSLVTILL